jgi:hypothetical protein
MAFSEKAVDADAHYPADAPEPRGRYTVDPVLIFLDLLELDAKRLPELHLCEAAKLPPAFNCAPNGDIVVGWLSIHAPLPAMLLELRLVLAAAMLSCFPLAPPIDAVGSDAFGHNCQAFISHY